MLRDVAEVSRPKLDELMLVERPPRFVWLNELNKSARNWQRMLSRIVTFFARELSNVHAPGPRMALRPRFPGRVVAPLAGTMGTARNAAGFKY